MAIIHSCMWCRPREGPTIIMYTTIPTQKTTVCVWGVETGDNGQKVPGIRDAIKVVVAIVSDCGCPQVPSETLRQAKYKNPEAKNTFWRILYCMVQILQYLKSGETGDIREAVSQTRSGPLKVTRMANSIRKYAFELNYYRPQFYCDAEAVGSCTCDSLHGCLRPPPFVPQLCHYHLRAASDSSIHQDSFSCIALRRKYVHWTNNCRISH